MKPKCIACGKEAERSDRNTDGTYLHYDCAKRYSLVLVGKGENGGNLYAYPATATADK
jgi:hypothetical protein